MAYPYGRLSPSGFANGRPRQKCREIGCGTLREKNLTRFEAEAERKDEWTEAVAAAGAMTLFPEARCGTWRTTFQASRGS